MSDSDQRPFAALPAPDRDDSNPDEPRTRRSLFPDGAMGIFVLLIVAAISGGLIAVYWPWVQGSEASSDRIATLETRVAQIAAGHAPTVAAAAYGEDQKSLAALKMRLDADEARLTAMEKSGSAGDDGGALKSDFDQLNGRIARLEQNPASTGGVTPLRKELEGRTQSLTDTTARLNQRIAVLERTAPPPDLLVRLDGFALKSGEDALDARLARLEGQNASDVMKRAATLLALADLVHASTGGDSFSGELAILRPLTPTAPELADLSKYAAHGAPTRIALREDLTARADSILAAERSGAAKSWSQRFWANLSNLVSIRRVGAVAGDGAESRVARAETDLRKDDLAQAIAEISALKGPARATAMPWLAQAEARLAVDHDTRSLMSRVIASLSEHP